MSSSGVPLESGGAEERTGLLTTGTDYLVADL